MQSTSKKLTGDKENNTLKSHSKYKIIRKMKSLEWDAQPQPKKENNFQKVRPIQQMIFHKFDNEGRLLKKCTCH